MKNNTFFYMGCSPVFSVGPSETVQKDVRLTLCRTAEILPKTYTVCVVCKETGRCVPNADVSIQVGSSSYDKRSDKQGRCIFQIPGFCRRIQLKIKKEGFTTRYIGAHTILQKEEAFTISSIHPETF